MKLKQTFTKIGLTLLTGAAFLGVLGATSSSKAANYQGDLVNQKQLTIGLEGTYKPYSYRQDGKLTGFEVKLGQALAKKLGLKAKFVPTKWDSLVAGVGADKYDLVLNNITQTPERKKNYRFSTPYIYSRYALISPKKAKLTKVQAIKGKTLAEGTGTNNAQVAKKYGAKISASGEFANSLALVRQGRADGTINSLEAYYAYAKSNKKVSDLNVTDLSKQVKLVKVSALLKKDNRQLQKAVDQALKQLAKDGTLSKLSKQYFGADITKAPK